MNERRKAAIQALEEISSGETDEKEREMYMEAIKILLSPESDVQTEAFKCENCSRNQIMEGENVCMAGCITAAECKRKFREIKKAKEVRKNAGNSHSK